MSAPIGSRLPPKQTLNSLIRGHILLSLILILTIFLSISSQSSFSLIKYRLVVTKLFIFFIAAFNIIFNYFILGCNTQKQTGITSKVRVIVRNGFLLFASSLFFHVLAILFGAPFLESTAETFHLGMTLSTTVILPALCVIGTNTSQWIKVFAQNSPDLGLESVLYYSAICSVIGAWLGAFPIPLDWDRPWQEWPITCIVGTLLGYSVGLVIGTLHLYVNYYRIKRIKIT